MEQTAMKTSATWLAVILGCGMAVGQQAPDPIKSPVERLRYDANKYHIHWYVRCSNDPGDDNAEYDYIARGWGAAHKLPPESVGRYIEDGSYDYWYGFGATQEQAAHNLWLALQGLPNFIAQHRSLPEHITRTKRRIICKPPIGSEIGKPIPKELQ